MKLKVIGGELKGRPLAAPKGLAVRPTAGRVREAVFNILFSRICNAVVLDLFAGSGAFGIEALSRGAARACFVDNNPAALSVIRQNVEACGLAPFADIHKQDATRAFTGLQNMDRGIDLVFMDPPYDRGLVNRTLAVLSESLLLKNNALIIAEHSLAERWESVIGPFHLHDQRKYGRTLVSFWTFMLN